jgi:hypothetical protein
MSIPLATKSVSKCIHIIFKNTYDKQTQNHATIPSVRLLPVENFLNGWSLDANNCFVNYNISISVTTLTLHASTTMRANLVETESIVVNIL